jgi:glycosyltransferase involved in cell wall biosynthesis
MMPISSIDERSGIRPRVCILVTTPLIVHFFLRSHIQRLSESCDVTLVTNFQSDRFTPVLNLPVRTVDFDIRRKISPLADLRALFNLLIFFRREKFDLVWAVAPKGGLLGMIAARLSGIRGRLFVFQGEVWASKRGIWRWLLKLMDRITAACANHLLAVSESEMDFLVQEGVVPSHSIQVLGEGSIAGVDLSRHCPNARLGRETRAALAIPESAVLVLYLGRLGHDKGVLDLADAFARAASVLDNLWLLVVGPDEEDLSEAIRFRMGRYANRLVMRGFTAEPEKFLVSADIFCLPSYREGFPISILEAAGAGVPSIGSDIYGVSDAIVDRVTGQLFRAGDIELLTQAIIDLAGDSKLRYRLGSKARERVCREFETSVVIGRYVAFIHRCME